MESFVKNEVPTKILVSVMLIQKTNSDFFQAYNFVIYRSLGGQLISPNQLPTIMVIKMGLADV